MLVRKFSLWFPRFTPIVFSLLAALVASASASPWEVPMAGNAFLTGSGQGPEDGLSAAGLTLWQNEESVFSVFFRIDRPAALELALKMKVPEGTSVIEAKIGEARFELKATGPGLGEMPLGKLEVTEAGYVRVDLKGVRRTGAVFAEVTDLVVASHTKGLDPVYVKSNEGNMFYWGRRGPSVHLAYQMPRDLEIEYAYSELTVPEGGDAIGSFYMANGFGEGYFGIQVKSATERWVLFSVWSPYQTNNLRDIPEADRVVLLAKGEGVKAGEFGNEGSGGQSYKVYPWKTGTTYRFLNSVIPDGKGNSIYTAWIAEAGGGPWQLIARFQRPKTNKHLTGYHSFLENFMDRNGYLNRRSLNGNQWVRDTAGEWHEITAARFTGDDTARGRHRLDYAGGVDGTGFFLTNGGFFNNPVELDQVFERPAETDRKPEIDFISLEGFEGKQ